MMNDECSWITDEGGRQNGPFSVWLVFQAVRAAILVIITSALTPSTSGQSYSAEGRLLVEVKSPFAPTTTNALTYHVRVVGRQYSIKIWPGVDRVVYYEYAHASGTMFALHHLTNCERFVSHGKRPAQKQAPYPAFVDYREIPPTDGTRAQFVWFAYASGRFFESRTNPAMSPIWDPEDPRTRRQSSEMAISYQLASAVPHLPMKVTFLSDGVYNCYNPASRKVDLIPLSSPYDKGFTKAIYEVLSVTNVPGSVLPKVFEFRIYATPIGTGAVPFERIVVRGLTTAASGAAQGIELPRFEGSASVVDYRYAGFVRQDGTNRVHELPRYSIQNGKWITAPEVERYRKSVESGMRLGGSVPGGSVSSNRTLAQVVLLVAIAGPAVWMLFSLLHRKQPQNETE